MKLQHARGVAALTIVELMMASGVAAMLLAALAIGSITLQKMYVAVDSFGAAQGDQMRCLDYITRDVRRSQSVSVTSNPPTISLVVPGYNDPTTSLPRTPSLSSGAVTYGSTTTVTYSLSGTQLLRQENGSRLVVASNVSGFTPTVDAADSTGKSVTAKIDFANTFKWSRKATNMTTFSLQAKATARQ